MLKSQRLEAAAFSAEAEAESFLEASFTDCFHSPGFAGLARSAL